MGTARRATPIPRAPKPAKPQRLRPPTFEQAYVEHGYDECEIIFKASPATVKRWLIEAGAARLRQARAAVVTQARLARYQPPPPKPGRVPVRDGIDVPEPVLRAAADHLRTMRHGGWFVAPTGKGDWWLGTGYRTPAQIVAFAVTRGFDEAAARAQARHAPPPEPQPDRRSWF